jgi:hypothetical protein
VTPQQLAARNSAIAEGQRRAWREPDIRARRIAGLVMGSDDPLVRALHRALAEKKGRDSIGRFVKRRGASNEGTTSTP